MPRPIGPTEVRDESPFMWELGRLNDEAGQLMVSSSAKLTGTGQKLRVQDLEEQVYELADLLVDYGLQRYHRYQRLGTIIDVENMCILRIGAGYEIFRERVKQWFGYDLIPDYNKGMNWAWNLMLFTI
ncbi:hypothetical protein RRF57_011560 [Xylaria bambusicola]|uniref:Uncharacterized protein n=1 Tax=Xylaria bambusicola TaxID=326684 RepID=A0AAN7UV49_9PEZI